MRKLVLALLLLFTLTACNSEKESPFVMQKEGIAPYTFSQTQNEIFRCLNLSDHISLLKFKAPKETRSMNMYVHTLREDGTWDTRPSGVDTFLDEDQSEDQLQGVLALMLEDDMSISVNDRCSAEMFATCQPIPAPVLDFESVNGAAGFLPSFQSIELEQEIPISLLILNSDGPMPNSALVDDYFTPEKFDGMDFVQVLTITFSASIQNNDPQWKGE